MPFEPVGGYIGGYLGTKIDLENQAIRRQEAARQQEILGLRLRKEQSELDRQEKLQAGLADVFSQSAMAAGAGDDKAMSDILMKGAARIMPQDMVHGTSLMRAGVELRGKEMRSAQDQLKQQKAQEATQAAILASIDSQETYGPAMQQYEEAGGKPIQGLTGNFADDAPLLMQRYKSIMPVKDQLLTNIQSNKLELAQKTAKSKEAHASAMLQFYRDKEAQRQEHQRIVDEEKSMKQLGKGDEAVARSEDRLHNMASKEVKPLLELSRKTALLKNLISQGNPVADKQVQQELTGFLGSARSTNKLYAENANFGNIADRVENMLTKFLSGTVTDQDRYYVIDMLDEMNNGVIKPALDSSKEQYAEIAKNRGYNLRHILPAEMVGSYSPAKPETKPESKPSAKSSTIEEAVKSAGYTYEPDKYEYRIGPNGLQRRAK